MNCCTQGSHKKPSILVVDDKENNFYVIESNIFRDSLDREFISGASANGNNSLAFVSLGVSSATFTTFDSSNTDLACLFWQSGGRVTRVWLST